MSLAPGNKLGAYEILSPLGTGGMGEVYRARDTKLQRNVALKILPESMARDAQRMSRFEREAQVLAPIVRSAVFPRIRVRAADAAGRGGLRYALPDPRVCG